MFYKRDLYPNLGLFDTYEKTIPDPMERTAYRDTVRPAEIVNHAGSVPIWLVVLGVIVLIIAFGGYRKRG